MPRTTDAADTYDEAYEEAYDAAHDETGACAGAEGGADGGCAPQGRRSTHPDAASRSRTLAAYAASAVLELPGNIGEEQVVPAARVVEPDGSVLLLLPPEVGAAVLTSREDVAAVLHLVDVAPVAVPHRVRAHCWIAGWLSAPTGADLSRATGLLAAATRDPALLTFDGSRSGAVVRLEPGEVLVDDLWGAEHIEPDEYADAAADPLAAHETELLQHLAASHGAELTRLCRLTGAAEESDRVAPVALDRFGLRLRCAGQERIRDVRFEFDGPVTDPAELGDALRSLFQGPVPSDAEGK
ncbi:DUF2470 domain-containing protein [Yinghuangia soli]|uniref:DUF2470 domain-containing protein n=1 Tax=Yinghuangia soli TaxID=2908204 RepID=A0AA41U2U9_9ACTN|nr:DUF2470 domain-containing protein [Yinghuangia soli]MCF2529052.1 DUF2470 domain-containing protein [Yinghuangia soli]